MNLAQHHVGLLVLAELQGLLETLLGEVPLPEVEVTHAQVVGDLPVLLLTPALCLPVGLHGELMSAQQEQRAGHLLDVARTVWVENIADLELLQRLLYFPLLSQY